MSKPAKKPYDPCDFDTYVGEPTRCDGCRWSGDPEQEGARYKPDPTFYHPDDFAELSGWFCRDCCADIVRGD